MQVLLLFVVVASFLSFTSQQQKVPRREQEQLDTGIWDMLMQREERFFYLCNN